MLALDGDGNPETGIDVAGRAADFSNASVDFDALRHEFASSLQRTAPDLNINIPDSRPIVWMYRSIGIAVPGNRLARQRDDWNADGAIDSDMTPNFDASGEVISTVRDLSGDGRPDEFVYYARDVLGRPTITRTDTDDDRDGTLDQRRTVRVTADAWGNPFRRIEHEDFGVDGTTDTQLVVDATFDRYGRPLTAVYSFDMNFDGVQDIVERHTIARDARGNPLSSVIEVDLDNDGTADGRYENTSTFDGNDRLITQVYERDLDGDGQLESRMSQAWTYDAAGRVSAGATQDDADGDGAFERSENSTNDYDALGNLVHSLSQGTTTNYPYSFMVDSRYEYDADRRRLRTVQDYSFAGSPTSRFTETNAYDVNGFPVSWESRNDDLFEGGYWLDYANYTHSGEGAQTSLTTGSRDDQGFNEISQTQNFEYVTSPDALTQIVTNYLPPL
jgi:hypothetical protein